MDSEKSINEHFAELRSRAIKIIISIIVVTSVTLTFGIKESDTLFHIPLLYPDPFNNISVQIIKVLEKLVPNDVRLIQTKPAEAFMAQLYVSLILGLIISMPIIIREAVAFIAPALYENEKKMIAKIAIPSIILFIIGSIFSYLFIIPFMLQFLYQYGNSLGILTYLSIMDFVTFILYFILIFGISFQIPIIMYILTKVGIVDKSFWKDKLKYAIVSFVILGAIIAPDGSGITMWFIALPMICLYLIGMLIINKLDLN